MSNLDSARLTQRRPGSDNYRVGINPQLVRTPSVPPGPFRRADGLGGYEEWDLDPGAYQQGTIVAVTGLTGNSQYVQLYIYIDTPDPEPDGWTNWKKVDLDWPKIDSRTGQPFDQYLEWYSPLAE